ncbi:S8 family serine peptidase [Paraburkholderia sp. Clong3]|uniref:S8 family serine peptidase n=1 Tax=Paraburkholderia sp. Clong3 TaxID=2991061 RepID=UPI003D1D1F65
MPTESRWSGHATSFAELERRGLQIPEALKGEVARHSNAMVRVSALADRIFVTFALPTGGRSRSVPEHDSESPDVAIDRLEAVGFKDVMRLASGISAAGTIELVSRFLNVVLSLRYAGEVSSECEKPDPSEPFDRHRLFIAPPKLVVPCPENSGFGYAAFAPPPRLAHEMRNPPPVSYYSPASADIASLLGKPSGLTGAGVTVAIVDTGFYRHRCFNGYDYHPMTTGDESDPDIDDRGHGTSMAWNVFAVAPQARVLGYKFSDQTPAYRAFGDAVNSGADIICCSWCYLEEDADALKTSLRDPILNAIKQGTIVIFAVGNRSNYSILNNLAVAKTWPASMPEVIAVGGIHADPNRVLRKSNLSNEFVSSLNPGRVVPDIGGLCGLAPHGIYFVLPTQPRSEKDKERPGRPHPNFDETKKDDGWWGGSGTSSATAQMGGVAALLVQAARQQGYMHLINQAYIKHLVCSSAKSVPPGPSGIHYGLADVTEAVKQI